MKGLKNVRLGLAGLLSAALVAVGAFLVVFQTSALTREGTSRQYTCQDLPPVGISTSGFEGLSGWTITITYDESEVCVFPPTIPSRGCQVEKEKDQSGVGALTIGCGNQARPTPPTSWTYPAPTLGGSLFKYSLAFLNTSLSLLKDSCPSALSRGTQSAASTSQS